MNLFNSIGIFFFFFLSLFERHTRYREFSLYYRRVTEDFITCRKQSRHVCDRLMRQWLVAQLATRCRTSRGKIEFPSPLYGFDALFLETPSFRIRCLVVVPRNLVRAVNKVFTRRVNEMHVDFLFFFFFWYNSFVF